MNAVYISQLYLSFTLGSQAHQVFVSGKTRDQSKRPELNQQTIRLENGAQENKHIWCIDYSTTEVKLRVAV